MAPPKVNKIGKYEVLDVIGRGGMGMVYKAIDPTIGRVVAIKKVTSVLSDDPDLLKRFYREAQSTGKLQHPNIVTLHDLGDQDGVPYLVMEYLEGDSLEKVIKERRPYSLAEKLNIIIQVCEGLGYAHQRQIIHRDVKPGNVVVLKDGGVKIVDFGIAQLGNERFTRTGQVVGSLYYMSPEQIQGADIDARSDIYSTGVVLFEFLSEMLPFQGKDPTSTLAKILHDRPSSLTSVLRQCPPELDQVVQRALSKDRKDRYGSMEDFAFDLQSVQDNLSRDLIASCLRSAEVSIQGKEWDKAREYLRQVLKFDKQHRRANELLREVQRQIQEQQIGEQVRQLRSRAEDALGARQWDEAITLLDQAVSLDGTNSGLIEFRNSVKRSSAQLTDALRKAEFAHQDGDLETAKQAVEEALNVDPQNTMAKALNAILSKEIAERSKKKKIEDFVAGARKEIGLRHFTSALDLLKQAEGIDASVPEVHQLIHAASAGREHERRRRALEEACSQIEDLLNRDEYTAACALADEAMQKFPEDLGLLKLRSFAEKQREAWTRRLFIEAQITAARQLTDSGQLIRAQGVLNAALERYADDSGLTSLLAMVTDGIARQEAQRKEAERQAAEKRRYLNLQLAAAAELQRSGQAAQALTKLRDALRHYPDSQELQSQIAAAEDWLAREEEQRKQAEQEARRRRAEVEKEIAASRQMLASRQTGQALVVLEQALRRYPESEELKSQLEFAQRRLAVEQAERERAEQETRRQRAEIDREIAKAQQLLESRQASRAVAVLEQVLGRHPESEELKAQLEVAQRRLASEQVEKERYEQEMRRNEAEIEKEIASARQLLESNQSARALAALGQALRRYPKNEKLKAQQELVQRRVADERAQREQEARRRQMWIESEITSTRQLLDSKQASQAVAALEQVVRQYPDSEELKAELDLARRRLAAEQAEQERAEREARLKQEEIEQEIATAWQLLDAKQTHQAMLVLEQAVRRFPESKELKSQLELAKERFAADEADRQRVKQEELRKRTEIEKEIAAARQLLGSNQFGRAISILEQALGKYPGSQELKSQLESVRRLAVEQVERERAEQEARRQQAEIEKELASARPLLDSGQTSQAVACLEGSVRRFPQSKELRAQLDLASQRLTREQDERARAREQAARRERDIESQIAAARRLLESKQTLKAVETIELAAQRFPDSEELRSELAVAHRRLKQERTEQEQALREAQARKQRITAVVNDARRFLKENQTSKACGLLEDAVRNYPESEELRSQLAASRQKLAQEQADREEAENLRARLEVETSRVRELLDSGRPEDAIKAAKASLRSFAKDPQLLLLLETAMEAAKHRKTEERRRKLSTAVSPAPIFDKLHPHQLPKVWLGGALAVAVAISGAIVYRIVAHPAAVMVSISPNPDDSAVVVDGRSCVAPCRLGLSPGPHTVEASHEGYQTLNTPIQVERKGRSDFPLTLSPIQLPSKGTTDSVVDASAKTPASSTSPPTKDAHNVQPGQHLIIDGPPGAEVMVDNDRHDVPGGGKLDVLVQAGLRHVEVNAKGFTSWKTDVSVKAGKSQEVEAKLMPNLPIAPTPEPPHPQPPAAPFPSGPFEVNRKAIERGQKAELNWDIRNATSVKIDGQPVSSSGSMPVTPTDSTTIYHLVATGPGGEYSKEAVVLVNAPAPPRPTTDAATVSEQDKKAITDLLQQYAQSYERKDAKKVQELFPGISKEQLKKIKETYGLNVRVGFSNLAFSRLTDGKIQVSCTQSVQSDQIKLRSEKPNFSILVAQRGGNWVINYIPLNDQ
jgi:eukaryotic-like serine/threonine-protein kinase